MTDLKRNASVLTETGLERWQPYPEYRDSGVEWIGDIPAHWGIKRLKTMVSIRPSNVDKKSSEDDIPVRLCNYTDVYYHDFITADMDLMAATATLEQIRRFELKAGDVIITKDSEAADDIAIAAYIPHDLPGIVCGYHLALLRPLNNSIVGRYLFRAFAANPLSSQFEIAAHGITRYGLSTAAIADAFFLCPPPDEQQAIADFLDRETSRIDELIEKRERFLFLLDEKKALLTIKAIDGTIIEDSANGIKGWFGTLPESWDTKRAKFLFRERQDRSVNGDEELLSVSHITGVTKRSEKNVNMFLAESNEGYKLVSKGDVVINTMWAWMGAIGVSSIDGLISPSYGVYSPITADYKREYLDLLLRSRPFIAEVTRRSKGIHSSRLRLYPDAFLDILLPVPSIAVQQSILEILKVATEKEDRLASLSHQSLNRLHEFRSALITAAVTGQINVTTWAKRGMTDQTLDTIEGNTAVH